MLSNRVTLKHNFLQKKELNKSVYDQKIQDAKQVTIESLFNGNLKKTGRVLMGNCPFHSDPSPSFAIYPQTNTYHCFGCNETGDVISFYMKQNEVSFQEALGALAGD